MLDENCSPHLKLYHHIICIQIVKIMKNFKILINTLSLGKHKVYPATLRQNSGVKQGSPQAHTKRPLFYLFLRSLLLFVLFVLLSFWSLFLQGGFLFLCEVFGQVPPCYLLGGLFLGCVLVLPLRVHILLWK